MAATRQSIRFNYNTSDGTRTTPAASPPQAGLIQRIRVLREQSVIVARTFTWGRDSRREETVGGGGDGGATCAYNTCHCANPRLQFHTTSRTHVRMATRRDGTGHPLTECSQFHSFIFHCAALHTQAVPWRCSCYLKGHNAQVSEAVEDV